MALVPRLSRHVLLVSHGVDMFESEVATSRIMLCFAVFQVKATLLTTLIATQRDPGLHRPPSHALSLCASEFMQSRDAREGKPTNPRTSQDFAQTCRTVARVIEVQNR